MSLFMTSDGNGLQSQVCEIVLLHGVLLQRLILSFNTVNFLNFEFGSLRASSI